MPVIAPVATRASSNSLLDVVDNAATAMVLLAVERSIDTVASIVIDVETVAVAVKVGTVAFALFTVIAALVGLKVYPVRLGVTVYDPFRRPEKVKLPDELAVVVALEAPVSAMVAPLPVVPTEPVIVQVPCVAVKFGTVAFALLTVTAALVGLKV